MNAEDPFNLYRFLVAQEGNYSNVIQELKSGKKVSHWMWYIFPQIIGLGSSPTSNFYAIESRHEALTYINHRTLGLRLRACSLTLLEHKGKYIEHILGHPDDLKLQSSMTLFSNIAPEISEFQEIIDVFYAGKSDPKTESFLSKKT